MIKTKIIETTEKYDKDGNLLYETALDLTQEVVKTAKEVFGG